MKNKILLYSAALLLLVFLVFGTYCWYLFFLGASDRYGSGNLSSFRDHDIILNDDGNQVYYNDATSITDIEVKDLNPYTFKIQNYGSASEIYTLYLEDVPINYVDDGCTYDTLLKRDQLKYQLKLNGEVVREDLLSNIDDNILDKGTIPKDKVYEYELRIFIHDKATNWEGKHYHYRVVLNNGK